MIAILIGLLFGFAGLGVFLLLCLFDVEEWVKRQQAPVGWQADLLALEYWRRCGRD